MEFKMAKLALKGKTLFDGATAILKAADDRGLVVLEKLAAGEAVQVALTYSKETKSWVDARYKHVVFVLDEEKSKPVMEAAINSDKSEFETKHVAKADAYVLGTDGGAAIETRQGNLVNMNELKDTQTGKLSKSDK